MYHRSWHASWTRTPHKETLAVNSSGRDRSTLQGFLSMVTKLLRGRGEVSCRLLLDETISCCVSASQRERQPSIFFGRGHPMLHGCPFCGHHVSSWSRKGLFAVFHETQRSDLIQRSTILKTYLVRLRTLVTGNERRMLRSPSEYLQSRSAVTSSVRAFASTHLFGQLHDSLSPKSR